MKTLNIAKDLKLPAEDAIESKVGILGRSGGGKSGMLKVWMEELVRNQLPFTMFDASGVAWGLRSSLDGSKPSGMHVLVVGGPHGDVPLDRAAGADIARTIVEANVSCIIDFSEEPSSAYMQFVQDFAETMWRINKSPRILMFDEVHRLAPQNLFPEQRRCFAAIETLVSMGRNKGLGIIVSSQRPAKVHTDIRSQLGSVFVFGTLGTHDRKALKEWVDAKADPERMKEFIEGLGALKTREAWFWAPVEFGGHFRKIYVRDFTTFHPDTTHLRRAGLLKVKPVTTDITAVVAKLGPVMERLAKQKKEITEAPKLQARIRHLEAELAKAKARPPPAAAAPKVEVKRVEIPILQPAELRRAEALIRATNAAADKLDNAATKFALGLSVVAGELSSAVKLGQARAHPLPATAPAVKPPTAPRVLPARPRLETPAIREARASVALDEGQTHDDNDGHDHLPTVKAGARVMLQQLALHGGKLSHSQVATLSRIKPRGSTFRDYKGVLKRRGFVLERGDVLELTAAGRAFVGDDLPESPQTVDDVLKAWRPKLKAGAAKMLQAVADGGAAAKFTRASLGEAVEIPAEGSTFRDYFGVLKRNDLIAVDDEGFVVPGPALELAASAVEET